jgi:hypothetical protein
VASAVVGANNRNAHAAAMTAALRSEARPLLHEQEVIFPPLSRLTPKRHSRRKASHIRDIRVRLRRP